MGLSLGGLSSLAGGFFGGTGALLGLGGLSSIFGSSSGGGLNLAKLLAQAKPPPAEETPKAPTTDEATLAAQEKIDMLRRRRGRSANLFTGPLGAGLPDTATKTLLGG